MGEDNALHYWCNAKEYLTPVQTLSLYDLFLNESGTQFTPTTRRNTAPAHIRILSVPNQLQPPVLGGFQALESPSEPPTPPHQWSLR